MAIKYKLKNIGPLKEAEIELGDLTIIAGENNAGKTYLTYALYGFLNAAVGYEMSSYLRAVLILNPPSNAVNMEVELTDTPKSIIKEVTAVVSYSELEIFIKKQMKKLCGAYSKDLHKIFAMPDEQFQIAQYECDIGTIDFLNGEIEIPRSEGVLNLTIDENKNKITITTQEFISITPQKSVPKETIKNRILRDIFTYIINRYFLFAKPFILPAERFGVSLFYKELDFTKSRLVEELQLLNDNKNSRDREYYFSYNRILDKHSSRYAQTIRDHIDSIRDIEFRQKNKSPLWESKLYDGIKEMMGGYYRYANNEIQFISTSKKNKAFKIPLHAASSSAKGLAAFYFYLKHDAKEGQLFIIDEPESHLDTANQRKLARLLARCVNAGIKIFINTHSDYLVQELNNLIKLSADFEGKDIFLKKFKHEKYFPDEFLNPQRVKGYICENGTLTKCKVDKHGIDMTNFDKTIRDINSVSDTLDHLIGD